MPGPQRGAPLPYTLLAGVVPCPAGWLVATARLQGISAFPQEPEVFQTFIDVLDYKPAFQVIALHLPIGLPDDPGPRRCDTEARRLLGFARGGSVLATPTRAAVRAKTRRQALAANGGRLSAVTATLMPRIREVDAEMQPYWQRTVYEVHPELSFYQLNEDRPVGSGKRTPEGLRQRRKLLAAKLPGVEKVLDAELSRVREWHLTDVAACLWTARRITARAISRLPEDPEWDGLGLRMEILR
jgi:predicted RNase H-like nuclease